MFTITGVIEGDKEMSVALGVVAEGVKDWSVPFHQTSNMLLHTFDMNFDARGGLLQAGGWAPRKRNYPWPILEKTGDMRSQFRSDMDTNSVVLSNAAPYFKYHQSNKPRKKLPRRIMMRIDEERRNTIIKIFQDYILKVVKRGGA